MTEQPPKSATLQDLRARIAQLEGLASGPRSGTTIGLGHEEIDGHLPGGGLHRGGLHEVTPASYPDMGAATGFLTGLAARCANAQPERPLLWCETDRPPFDQGRLHAPGLAIFGLDPDRLILAEPGRNRDLLWTMEEALRAGVFAAVIAEIPDMLGEFDLTATRRLQLAAEEGQTPALLLTGHRNGQGNGKAASAALTRWRISALRMGASESRFDQPCWQVELERCRHGNPASWAVRWQSVEHEFAALTPPVEKDTGIHPLRSAI